MIRPGTTHSASSEDVRDINRSIVLNLIRTRQPTSRADLARLSGMQRSTISLIVEDLVEQSWVVEGPTARLPRGRHPTSLRLNGERAIIGVDIRPEHTSIALSDVNGRFSSIEVIPTPADPARALESVIAATRNLARTAAESGKTVNGVGISVPGRYDHGSERLIFAPNLGWRDVDLRGPVARATNLDVDIENAANACVLAATWFDGMESVQNLVVLTVSEGIGAGLLINGRLASGVGGMAGEFGHVSIDSHGPPCNCGCNGCWEVFASNRAAVRYYRELVPDAPEPAFSSLLHLANTGDANALASLRTMAGFLGRGMRMLVAGLAPERVLVVGELTGAWHHFGPAIEVELRNQALPGGHIPELIPVDEDGSARLRGTVALVLQKHFGPQRG